LKIAEFFFTHFKIQTARREGTSLTPSITVIVNSGYMFLVPIIFIGYIIFHRYEIPPNILYGFLVSQQNMKTYHKRNDLQK